MPRSRSNGRQACWAQGVGSRCFPRRHHALQHLARPMANMTQLLLPSAGCDLLRLFGHASDEAQHASHFPHGMRWQLRDQRRHRHLQDKEAGVGRGEVLGVHLSGAPSSISFTCTPGPPRLSPAPLPIRLPYKMDVPQEGNATRSLDFVRCLCAKVQAWRAVSLDRGIPASRRGVHRVHAQNVGTEKPRRHCCLERHRPPAPWAVQEMLPKGRQRLAALPNLSGRKRIADGKTPLLDRIGCIAMSCKMGCNRIAT